MLAAVPVAEAVGVRVTVRTTPAPVMVSTEVKGVGVKVEALVASTELVGGADDATVEVGVVDVVDVGVVDVDVEVEEVVV